MHETDWSFQLDQKVISKERKAMSKDIPYSRWSLRHSSQQQSYSTLSLVSTGMGDHLQVATSSQYVTSNLGQLSLVFLQQLNCVACQPWLLLLLHPFNVLFSRTTWVSQHQKGKPFWILTKQETMGGIGIGLTIWKSFAPCSGQITMPGPHHSVFTGWMPFLPPNQQRQSTEGLG